MYVNKNYEAFVNQNAQYRTLRGLQSATNTVATKEKHTNFNKKFVFKK